MRVSTERQGLAAQRKVIGDFLETAGGLPPEKWPSVMSGLIALRSGEKGGTDVCELQQVIYCK